MITAEQIARLNVSTSSIIQTFAQAANYDRAISAMVLAADPGNGINTAMREATAVYSMEYREVRCDMLDITDFAQLQVPGADGITLMTPLPLECFRNLPTSQTTVIVLTEVHARPEFLPNIFEQINALTAGPVIVVLTGRINEIDDSLNAIETGLDIHRAYIPTVIIEKNIDKSQPSQPILLYGSAETTGSKRGERYLEILVSEPYEHTVNFVLYGDDDQSDDDLNEFLSGILDANDEIAVRLECIDGQLVCGTKDITGD